MISASTILIVDDDPVSQETLAGLLANQSYELFLASRGSEALTQAAQLVPDLILLDVMMPDMDGFEVCRRLRLDPLLADVPVIMVTALDDRDSRLRGFEVGADDFICKPFDRLELRARVRAITRLNRQRRLRTLELQNERDRTRAILEALGEAVIVTDPAGIIQYVNPATIILTGFTGKELLRQNWRICQSDRQSADFYSHIEATVQAGQIWHGEVTHRRKDGTLYEAMLTVAPLFQASESDRPVGFVSVQRDITPLKETERLKDQFVSDVSHELSTPLSVITLLADNLDALYDRLNKNRRRKMVQDIQKHAQTLNDLVGGILEVSRLDNRRVSMERQPLDLAQLAHDEVDKLLPLAQEKAQGLSINCTERFLVWGNENQLRQVIRNLLENGIKYTPETGQINCECRCLTTAGANHKGWPYSANLPNGRWAAFRVVDTGCGISQTDLPRIFERFFRVKTQGNIRGTGLGLAIVRELIELHTGHIGVTSKPGQGSIFAIYLPLLDEE